MDVIVFTVLMAAAIGTGFVILFWRLLARRQEEEPALDWFRSYSIESYRPMQRLLDEGDYRFLASQPGYNPAIAKELRSERKKIFRIYLRQLRQDFQGLVRVGKLMIVEARTDRSDLADAIWRLSYQFYWNLLLVHVTMPLPVLANGTNGVKTLLRAMDRMHQTVCSIEQHYGLEMTA